jgi:3,4-dihydroxy 2-butanone 4-phosphate synthase/GTP cyclohydrolase II
MPNFFSSKNIKKNTIKGATLRYYGIGAQILINLKVKKMILVSSEQKRLVALDGFGIKIIKQEILK